MLFAVSLSPWNFPSSWWRLFSSSSLLDDFYGVVDSSMAKEPRKQAWKLDGWESIFHYPTCLRRGKKKERKKEKREERKRKAGEQEFMLSSLGALGHWPRFKGKAIVPTSRPVNPLINHRRGRLFEAKDKSALGLKASSRNSFSPFPFWNSTECTLVHFLPREEVPFRFLCPRSFVRGFVLIPFLRRFRADTRLE